jgi:hypothetical protein
MWIFGEKAESFCFYFRIGPSCTGAADQGALAKIQNTFSGKALYRLCTSQTTKNGPS